MKALAREFKPASQASIKVPDSARNRALSLEALQGIPSVKDGDDVASLISDAIDASEVAVRDGLLIVIAQKIVSKAEGRSVRLESVVPGSDAKVLADQTGKDARLVELILSESKQVVRQTDNLIITENNLGVIMANAGIDQSNVDDGCALLLPEDPDLSAARIGKQLGHALGFDVAVIIADSAGRPWRRGIVGFAIGAFGVPTVLDVRGSVDLNGRELLATEIGVADSIAAAANLLMGQGKESQPVVLVHGYQYEHSSSTASDILRDPDSDLFR